MKDNPRQHRTARLTFCVEGAGSSRSRVGWTNADSRTRLRLADDAYGHDDGCKCYVVSRQLHNLSFVSTDYIQV